MFPSVRSCAGQKVKSLPAASSDRITFTEPLLFLYPKWFQVATYEQQSRSLHTYRRPRPRSSAKQARSNVLAHTVFAHSNSSRIDAHPSGTLNDETLKISSPVDVSVNGNAKEPSSRSRGRQKPKREIATGVGREKGLAKDSEDAKYGSPGFVASGVDGLELMRLLSKVPLKRIARWHESRRYSTRFITWLTGTTDRNMWLYSDGRGCEIEVVPPAKDDPEHCQVLIYGSSGSQDMASEYLKDQVVQFSLTAFPNSKPPSHKNRIEKEQAHVEKGRSPPGHYRRVDDIEVPNLWTIRTFYEYVTSVVHHQVPRTIERILYPGSESYNQVAGRILKDLFSNPHLKHFHSLAALRQALLFFKNRTQLAPDALKVWIEACESGIVPDTLCFNYEIERCLTVRNAARVQYLLYLMAKSWTPPDIDTWCLVLKSMKGWTDRLSTITFLLRHRTAAQVADKQALARLVIQADFARFVQNKTELHEFIEHMSQAFGSDWLSSSVIAAMIQQCLRLDKLELVSDVLAFAHGNKIEVENESSILLVDAVRRSRDFQDCVTLLKAVVSVQDTSKIDASVELLFKAAWKNYMPNMCRVLWHHAATHGTISYAMQQYVIRGIAYNTPTSDERTGLSQNLLAAITVGVDIAMHDFRVKYPKLYEHGGERHALEHLCQWTPNDGLRHEQLQLMHCILEDDLTVWKSHQPMSSSDLLSLLEEACKIDRRWKDEKSLHGYSSDQILQQAIEVNVESMLAEQTNEAQEAIDETELPRTTSPSINTSFLRTPTEGDTGFWQSKNMAENNYKRHDLVENEPEMKKSYSLMSSSTSSSSSVFISPTVPAIAMANPSALDILFQHLKQAWETV